MSKKLKLGMFYMPCGHHITAWRHPEVPADSGMNIDHIVEVAKLAERGLFDMFFMADSVTFWRGTLEAMTRDSLTAWIDPFTVMASLAQHTKNIGLICTATSTFDTPYALARRFASLDRASGGRAGWNLVTSGNKTEAWSFGLDEIVDKAERYSRAEEFAHAVRGLWNSWDEDAFIFDKETGVFFDKDKMHVLEHQGQFYRCKGPLNVPFSAQGEPVQVQAGASEAGKKLAASSAEVVFAASPNIEHAKAFYTDVKGRLAAHGRSPNDMAIMPGLSVTVGETSDEAAEKHEELQELIDPTTGLQILSDRLDFDLSGYDVDGPLPEIPITQAGGSRAELLIETAKKNNLTIKQLYREIAGTRGHMQITGTPKDVADMMEQWLVEGACDGFNLLPALFPNSLKDFVDLVIPELQNRGLFRTEYEATTLRGNLGLNRPAFKA